MIGDEEFALIKRQNERNAKYLHRMGRDGVRAHRHRTALLAEVDRLRAEIAVQQGCCDGAAAQDAHIRQEREEHRSEIEKLRAEVERGYRAHKIACEGGDLLRDEIKSLMAQIERLRDVLQRVSVRPSGDSTVQIAFVSEGCTLTYPVCPQTTWALEAMIEFDKDRRNALEGKP